MAYGPTNVVHRVAGYNLAGLGALTTMDETLTAGRATVDLLGPKGALLFDRATGKRTYTLAESGYLTSDQADLRRVLASGQAAHPWPSVTGRFGEGVGKDVRIMTDLDIGDHSLPVPSGDELLSVSLTWFVPPDAQLYEARVISGGLGAGAGPGNTPAVALRVDNGAASADGCTVVYQFDPLSSRWRGYPTLRMQLRGYTGSTWSNLGAAWTVARDGAPFHSVEIAGTIPRYLALSYSFSGARDAFELAGAHASGAKVLTVDGGTGTERIQEGDTLSIGGGTYTVAAAEETGNAGEWTVTLETGLTGAGADNAAVTQTGTGMLLDHMVAVARH